MNQRIIHDSYVNNELALKLESDSTFLFLCNGCMSWDSISGNWAIANNKLVLNSYITNNDTKSLCEIVKCDTCINDIYIKVVEFGTTYELEHAQITVFKGDKLVLDEITNKEGNVIINGGNVGSIKVDYVGFNSCTFVPDKIFNILYVVNLKLEELNRKVIENEIWKVRKYYIESPEGLKLVKQADNKVQQNDFDTH